MICLKQFSFDLEYVFATVRTNKSDIQATNCVISVPVNSEIMKRCFLEANEKDVEKLYWGETGPELLTSTLIAMDLMDYIVEPMMFNPIDWWDHRKFIETGSIDDHINTSYAVHLWDEMWRRNNIDKATIPQNPSPRKSPLSMYDII